MDVNNAFLNDILKKCTFNNLKVEIDKTMVCNLHKALYGLK